MKLAYRIKMRRCKDALVWHCLSCADHPRLTECCTSLGCFKAPVAHLATCHPAKQGTAGLMQVRGVQFIHRPKRRHLQMTEQLSLLDVLFSRTSQLTYADPATPVLLAQCYQKLLTKNA